MAIWKYINDNDGVEITTPDLTNVAAVESYATTNGHVIRGGSVPPGTTLFISIPTEETTTRPVVPPMPVQTDNPWRFSVKDRDLTTPPLSPSNADRYIVATSATGDWTTQDNNIAQWNDMNSRWDFLTPLEGWTVWVDDEDGILHYNGTSWELISGETISIDNTSLSEITVNNAQEAANELNRLVTRVNSLSGGTRPNQFNRPIATFTSTIDIDDLATFQMFDDELGLYAAAADQRIDFRLPTDATIGANFPVTILVLHQGGTSRITTGGGSQGPNNTIRIRPQGGEELRRNSETGALLTFSEIHQNDLATITKEDADSPWIVRTVTLSSGALLLPDGIFNLSPTSTIRFTTSLTHFIVSPSSDISISAGDAFRVTQGDDNFAGFGVAENDVLVALQDNPSRIQDENNDNWLIIRNAHNNAISLTELHFLGQVSETDTFTYTKLEDRSDVQDVRIFLADGILDHAPFITPSTDPDNPQGDGTSYLGGDEDINAEGDFVHTGNLPSNLVYIDVDGAFNVDTNLDDVFFTEYDLDGNVVARHDFNDFRGVTLTGSGDTYYVFDTVGAVDNYSGFNYLTGKTLRVEYRATNRHFSLNSNVNLIPSLADGSIPIEKLDSNTQALIESNHSLSDAEQTKLDGLQTDGTATPWTAGDLFVKDNDLSGDQAHYFNVGQGNGILSGFEGNRHVTFVVPNFVTVTQLQLIGDETTKNPVTRLGVVTLNSGNSNSPTEFTGTAFTSTLPQSSFDINNPVGDSWQVDGIASNLFLSGADDTFKIHRGNLDQDIVNTLDDASHNDPIEPYQLPDNLNVLNNHLSHDTTTTTGWRSTLRSPIRTTLTRQFAALWDETRANIGTNYFDDITGTEVVGFQGNNIFSYPTPTDPLNRNFPGAQNYILNSNVRIRNNPSTNDVPITPSFRKIISFNYALSAPLPETTSQNMLRVGSSSSTAMIGISGEEGLFLNIGRQDGGQQSRTYEQFLSVIGGHWHDLVDDVETAEAEIIIPQSFTGSLTVNVDIQLDNNGNDEGTHRESFTITNVGADQTIGDRTFNFTGYPSITTTITYEHDNNDLSNSRRVIFLRPTQPFTNAALTYNVTAGYDVTENWNHPTTYARYPINAGNSHDDYGLFDPHLWNTEHVHERNRVILVVSKWLESDQSADPELAVTIIVDGEHEGSGKIRLHRPASDFDFNDMNFGNFSSAVAHIQCYDYDPGSNNELVPSRTELMTLYNNENRWLGAFRNDDVTTETIKLDTNFELLDKKVLIVEGSDTATRYEISVDDSAGVGNEVINIKAI